MKDNLWKNEELKYFEKEMPWVLENDSKNQQRITKQRHVVEGENEWCGSILLEMENSVHLQEKNIEKRWHLFFHVAVVFVFRCVGLGHTFQFSKNNLRVLGFSKQNIIV